MVPSLEEHRFYNIVLFCFEAVLVMEGFPF